MKNQFIQDPTEWVRLGRGKNRQFFATDDEVQTWLLEGLPKQYAPYELIVVDRVKHATSYIDQAFAYQVEALSQCLHDASQPRYEVWIRSKCLTPEIPIWSGVQLDHVLSFNGLVLLQHGLMIRDRRTASAPLCRDVSRIAIVDKVQHRVTGEIREYKEYVNIYTSLDKVIRRALVYSSIVWDMQGNESEDTRLQLWTEGAVTSYHAGVRYVHRPGRRLRG